MTPLAEITPALVARAADGDRAAVEEIVRALQRPVFNVALRMLVDRADAEDAMQEALLRIVTRLGQFRGDARFSTWAWQIAVRRILDHRARRAQQSFAAFAEDLADGLDPAAEERAEDAVLHRQLKVLCSRAMLQCLDPDHRITFILCELVDLSSQEVAEVLDVEPATVRKRLSRARAELSAFLGAHCGVYDAAAPCACHRRLGRALSLGRVDRDAAGPGELPALRAQLATVGELRRVAAFYRSDPEADTRRDLVAALRATLSSKEPS